jgi:multidrug resistance efflux pump
MAAGEYLRSAAASLQRAANSLHQQTMEMQANLTRLRSEKHHVIDKNSVAIKTSQAEQAATSDVGRRSRLSMKIQRLQNEIMAAEAELKKAEADVQRAVSDKVNQASGIETQAKQLESQASRLD